MRPSDFRKNFGSDGDLKLVSLICKIEAAAVGQTDGRIGDEALTGGEEGAVGRLKIFQYGTASLQADPGVAAADAGGAAGEPQAATLVTAQNQSFVSDGIDMALQGAVHAHDLGRGMDRRTVRADDGGNIPFCC